jgi:predicted permease
MPASFGFPVNHSLWLPLKVDPTIARHEGPRANVFGRLAPGVSVEQAQAEVRTIAAAEGVTTTSRVMPEVTHFVDALWSGDAEDRMQVMIFQAANIFFVALLAVCGANVATLVFARTATREGEISVRTALGASRSRIVTQLFIEALVLSSIAAVVGLSVAAWASEWAQKSFLAGAADGAAAPFWWDTALSNETLIYGGLLAVLSALIVGVIPALKATGPDMQAGLKATSGATMRFGGVWTGIIVSQIALTVFFLLTIVSLAWNISITGYRPADVAIAANQFATMRIEWDADALTDLSANYRALAERLGREPSVVDVTYGSAFPGMKHFVFFLELDGIPNTRETDDPLWSRSAEVAANYFDALGVKVVAGRGFTDADVEFDRPVAIVDNAFVQHVLGGRQPIGQRVRQPRNSENAVEGRWLEIVGVVDDLARKPSKTTEDGIIYMAARPANVRPLRVAAAVRGDAHSLAPRLSSIVAETDPMLRVYDATTLDRVADADAAAYHFFIRALAIVTAVALLLATAGVYALLAFNVARRTREIGIRTAVGADRWQLLSGIFARTFRHVALGVSIGSVPGTLLVAAGAPEVARGSGAPIAAFATGAVVAFMAMVAILACVVPARRALRIQPTEALRAE